LSFSLENAPQISERFSIPAVGELVQFQDTEGNDATVMQYQTERATEMGL